MTERLRRLAWPLAGAAALVGGTVLGWNSALLEAIAGPAPLLRSALVGVSAVVTLWLLVAAVRRLDAGRAVPSGSFSGRDVAALIRGVRFVFLAVAAFSAGAGWLLGHPLPFVIALVIAGVDVLETSLLLLVVAIRPDG
jgi:hypothetical protein